MKILLLHNGKDNGGNGSSIKRAFDRFSDWDVRFVRRQPSWIGYPVDIEWPSRTPVPSEVMDLWREADVVHMLDTFEPASTFPGYDDKPRVMHHLGANFTLHAEAFMARCRAERIQQLVTTFDLLYAPDLTWMPMACDVERMEREREAYRPGPRLRVVQSPAARQWNDTDEFIRLMADVPGIDVQIIEGVPWDECLRRKAQADILFDSFASSYGLSIIEAMGMGIPTVGGSAGPLIEERIVRTVGHLPYLLVTRETIAERVGMLVESPALREEYAERGRQIVREFHDDRKIVERLIPIYERALER